MKRKTERPFNNGTMTRAGFFGWIRSALRARSRYWKPVAEAKKRAKRKYTGTNKRQKFEYQCNECKNWFPDKEIHVDHIVPAGQLNSFDDLPGFVQRLFCEVDGLQCLCKTCHDRKTLDERRLKNNK